MPLKLTRRNGTGNYYIRGNVAGSNIYTSTGTSNRRAAENIRIRTEAQILERASLGRKATVTFAEAALNYINSGGETRFLTPILQFFGPDIRVFEIDNAAVNKAAAKLYSTVQPATINRQLITPISAILAMAAKTGLPLYHMDHIHYRPGWDERTAEEKDTLCHEIHMKDEWVFEGGHSRTLDERIERADTAIWLDLPVWLRMRRCLWRTVKNHGKTRPDLQKDCPERFDLEFYRFIWRTRNSSPAKIHNKLTPPPPGLKIHHFTSPKQVEGFLSNF